ncbi:hypothetical protein EUGRSUZ_F03618 [Eucalyptus grandis]|uniref:Uncharacterized protein n=2 Tax=Eucalyptus grandis TaxID=71139 RepID=A0ACC3KMA7_EUCGR|nr:hypothetical protein EUGRSUZ_F03618 [Eucalyptus grandis]
MGRQWRVKVALRDRTAILETAGQDSCGTIRLEIGSFMVFCYLRGGLFSIILLGHTATTVTEHHEVPQFSTRVVLQEFLLAIFKMDILSLRSHVHMPQITFKTIRCWSVNKAEKQEVITVVPLAIQVQDQKDSSLQTANTIDTQML